AFADTLYLKSGARVTGYFEGGTARVVKFRGADGVIRDYDILQVQQVQFGDNAPTLAATNTNTTNTKTTNRNTTNSPATPQLRGPAERSPAQAPSTVAANTAYTIPTG